MNSCDSIKGVSLLGGVIRLVVVISKWHAYAATER